MIAYGSNFGANKELAERFAERSDFYGYTSDVITLNELAESPPRTQPWLLVVMTSTYTSNPPSNATAFKSWLERTEPGAPTWRNCRYLVWGLGNTQWNAFLAFPRYVHKKLSELGATPLAEFAYGDVGSPVWERRHADWNTRVWPVLLELSGARPTEAAAARDAAEKAAAGALTGTDSSTAMQQSLYGDDVAPQLVAGRRASPRSCASCRRDHAAGHVDARRAAGTGRAAPHPAAGAARPDDPHERRRDGHGRGTRPGVPGAPGRPSRRSGPGIWRSACRPASPTGSATTSASARRTTRSGSSGSRGTSAPRSTACFMVPKTMNVRAVPKGVVLQVRNVLTNLVDITGRPTVPLLDLLLEKAADPAERSRLAEIRDVLQAPDGPGFAAARGDRRGRLRRAPAAGRVPVLLAEHLRVPAGGAAAPAALLLDELEPADPRRRRRPPDRRPRGHARAGPARP